jgi:HK97 family phage portal protein
MIAPSDRILWLPTSEHESRNWDYESGGYGGNRNPSGVRIDPETALRSTVVLACVRVLSSSVAGLPLHLYRRLPNGGKEIAREVPLYRILHERPNGWQTSYEWREQIMLHLLTHGQAFVEIAGAGPATQLIVLHPSRMQVERIENGRLRYRYREDRGTETIYSQDAIMHLRWLSDDGVNGMVPVELARDAIGLARACEIHGASFFGNGARPGVVLSTDSTISAEAAEALRNGWERMHRGSERSHRTAVLQGGLKPIEIGGGNMQESQFLETRRFAVEECARVWGVPPHLVGDLSRSSFSNIEQQSIDFVTNGLMPWLRRIESAIARDLITDDSLFAEFDTRGLLRADAAGRSAYFNTLWSLGVASVNEIRAWENMNPVDGGDVRFVQLNMTTLDKAAAAEPEPTPVVEEIVVEEPVADAVSPATEPAPDATPQVAEVSLNGAQITGLIAIVQSISDGLVTREGAAAMIAASFPSIPPAQIDAILAGVVERQPAPAAVAQPQQVPVVEDAPARSLESRAMTISIDFDRTFAADPQLWGEFARKSVADGNTVVMISRRPEEDRETVMGTLGEYADAFSQVLLVGGDTLKADAANAAGISVDVWVDDSPQTIRSAEKRAEPGTVVEGDFVSWGSAGGRARGRIDYVMGVGTLDVPGTDFKIDSTEDDPAALITVYEEVSGGWRATETKVGHKVSTLTKIDPLPEPPPAEEPRAKPRRRKRGG